jgi:uroporphyrinogen-III synthase
MKKILVVREFDIFSRILAENNFETINLQLIETNISDDLRDFEAKIARIENYAGVFITSRHAARILSAKMREKDVRFSGKVYILGSRSFDILKTEKLNLIYDESANTAREMMENIAPGDLKGKRFLFVRGAKSLRVVPEFLAKFGEVDETIVYETHELSIGAEEFQSLRKRFEDEEVAAACFFSPSQVESFIKQFGAEILHQTCIATIGKTTAEYFERENLTVDFVSSKSTAEIFAVELIEYLRKNLPTKDAKETKKREMK